MGHQMKRILIVLVILLVGSVVPSFADYVIKDAYSVVQTVFAFTCQTSKICSANVLINSSGVELGTLANPVNTDLSPASDAVAYSTSTLSVTGTFQQVLNPNASRRNCWVQNRGYYLQYIAFAATQPANLLLAIMVSPGGRVECADNGGGVFRGAVWVAGNSSDAISAADVQ